MNESERRHRMRRRIGRGWLGNSINLDYPSTPQGHKTKRARGWRVQALRSLAEKKGHFTARDLMDLCDGMTKNQAQALCASYIRKGELVQIRKGIGGPDSVEAVYTRRISGEQLSIELPS